MRSCHRGWDIEVRAKGEGQASMEKQPQRTAVEAEFQAGHGGSSAVTKGVTGRSQSCSPQEASGEGSASPRTGSSA